MGDFSALGKVRKRCDALQRPNHPFAHARVGGRFRIVCIDGFLCQSGFRRNQPTWQIAGVVFAGLALVWIAVWVLDFGYYNRLLIGSIAAIVVLEERSQTHKTISAIQLSTLVEDAVARKPLPRNLKRRQRFNIVIARCAFYIMVLAALVAGTVFCFWMYCHPEPISHNGLG